MSRPRRSPSWSSTAAPPSREPSAAPSPPAPSPGSPTPPRSRGRAPSPAPPSGRWSRSPTPATASYDSTCRPASPTARSTTRLPRSTLDDGTPLPGRHDGMGAFAGPDGSRCSLVRNHEVNGPGAGRSATQAAYDSDGAAAARRRSRSTRHGEVHRRLHQPERHADELLRRPDAVGRLGHLRGDGQRPRRRPRLHRRVQRRRCSKPHGYIFEVPAGGSRQTPQPITQGRTVRARGGRRSTRRGRALPDRGQLRLPVRVLPLRAPRATRRPPQPRPRRPAADARRRGPAQPAPRGHQDTHDRPRRRRGSTSTSRTSSSPTRRASRRRRATTPRSTSWATRAGRRAPPTSRALRGPDLRRRRRLLHRHPGRRSGR